MSYIYLNINLKHTISVFLMFHISFMTLNVYYNYFISKIVMNCFQVYLYNTYIYLLKTH